jgi:uncharacterized membrane protein YgcG
MKRLILAGLLLAAFMVGISPADNPYQLPQIRGAVSDYANVVEPQARESVQAMADELRRVTSVNFKALVIRQLPPGVKIEDYGWQVYKQWDVGRSDLGLEHGVLLLISLLDRRVKLIAGKEVEWVISRRSQEQTEWDVLAVLSRGRFSKGVEIGAMEITNKILAGWYASHKPPRFAIDWHGASLVLFALFGVSVVTTLVTGSDMMMGVSIFIGGLYGFIFLNLTGLILFALFGFLLTYKAQGKNGPKPEAEAKKHEQAG